MSDTWYLLSGQDVVGPFFFVDLQLMAANGKLFPNQQVSGDGQSWQLASTVAGLAFASPSASVATEATAQTDASAPGATASLGQLSYEAPPLERPMVSQRAIELVGQTTLWVRIMSVFMFVAAGLMVLAGVGMVIFALSNRANDPSGFLACIYIPLAGLYIAPAIFLWRYATYSKAFAALRHEQDLEAALQAQKSFWKFTAIAALVVVGFYVLLLLFAVAVGAFAFFMHRP